MSKLSIPIDLLPLLVKGYKMVHCSYSETVPGHPSVNIYSCQREIHPKSENRCIFHLKIDTIEKVDTSSIFQSFKHEVEDKGTLDFRGIKAPMLDISKINFKKVSDGVLNFSNGLIGDFRLGFSTLDNPIKVMKPISGKFTQEAQILGLSSNLRNHSLAV